MKPFTESDRGNDPLTLDRFALRAAHINQLSVPRVYGVYEEGAGMEGISAAMHAAQLIIMCRMI